ncbi:hypothetical protein ACMHYB_10075 [Sorangium sp. So ce1128]
MHVEPVARRGEASLPALESRVGTVLVLERPRKESSTCECELGTRIECGGHDGLVATLLGRALVEVTAAPAPVCQYLPADPIDQHVIEAFFQALSPLELDLYEKAIQSRHDQRREDNNAQDRELQRLRYEVQLARRQYDRVDPDNRLVASELERRWELALRTLHEAEERFERVRQEHDKVVPLTVPRDLRAAFTSLGKSLPEIWRKGPLSRTQRKDLLRCLIDKVVLRRMESDCVHVRLVWRGGAVSEADVLVPVGSLRSLSGFETMEAGILELETQGKCDEEIAALLTQECFRSPQRTTLLPSTVKAIGLRHQRIHRFHRPRPRHVKGFLTVPQLAQALGVKPH